MWHFLRKLQRRRAKISLAILYTGISEDRKKTFKLEHVTNFNISPIKYEQKPRIYLVNPIREIFQFTKKLIKLPNFPPSIC